MPTDPSAPKSPNPYQTTSTASKGGGGGIFFVILLLLLVGGGAAYYFLAYKPNVVVPMAQATPTPTATPKPSATPDKSGNPTYNDATRKQYVATAIESFKKLRQSKLQPFTDSFGALMSSGGFGAVGLTSKDAIEARRNLITQCIAANDEYAAFIKGQEAAYTAELKKTPLTPNDVEVESSYTGAKMPTDKIVQLRTIQNDSLKTGDQMLAYLESKFGAWSVNANKSLVFKKAADGAPFSALAKTYTEQVTAMNKLRDEINVVSTDDPTAAASPAAAAAPTPTGSSMPAATAAPSTKP